MKEDSRAIGHFSYIKGIFGTNTADLFKKIFLDFNLEDLRELTKLVEEMKYLKLGEGSTRATYAISDTKVIKIPTGSNGWQWAEIKASLTEFIIYKKLKSMKLFVPTELYFYKSIPVLIADRVSPLERNEGMAFRESKVGIKKFGKLCDGRSQIGKNSNGEIRCFDFGLEEHLIPAGKTDVSKNFSKVNQKKHKDVSPFLFPSELLPY
jgi:hypothetical protein